MCYCPSSDGGALISVALCMSPCSSDFIIDLLRHRKSSGVKSLRISHQLDAIFPADCPHLTDFHCRQVRGEYRRIHRVSQHIARFCFRNYSGPGYSYGRRLPGLRFGALPLTKLTPLVNLPAPGRHHTLYIGLRLSRVLCF